MMIKMTEDRFRKYDELEDDEKEVLDAFRHMELMSDYNRFKLYNFKVEDLINDYGDLKKLREEIQAKYFLIYNELIEEGLIEGELDASVWGITREHENETWDSELQLMSEIKNNFDIAIKMIESGEAEQMIIDEENVIEKKFCNNCSDETSDYDDPFCKKCNSPFYVVTPDKNPMDSDLFYSLFYKGDEYMNQQKYEEAIGCYDKLLDINMKNIRALLAKAKCYLEMGDELNAIHLYDKAIAINFNSISEKEINLYKMVVWCHGTDLMEEKKYDSAINYFDKILSIDENYTDAITYKNYCIEFKKEQ